MLAYLFWHRPQADTDPASYEQALLSFHRSLAHRRPVGLRTSQSFRVAELPWLPAPGPEGSAPTGGYEDWYLLEDFNSLGVLGEAAVGRGHRTAHDHAARLFGSGTAGLFALQEGDADALSTAPAAVWVARAPGSAEPLLGEMLDDGALRGSSCLWRRQLVLGPAPEFCLLADTVPAGVSPERLPGGWSARTITREELVSA